jgi:hypothetical protein
MDALGSDTTLTISTYPLATHALVNLKRHGMLTAPLAVYLTDPSVHRICVTSGAELTVAPNETAARQARRLGAARTVVASPLVAPGFRPVLDNAERDHLRALFGLPAGRRLALVLSGSWGVGEVAQTVADIAATGRARPVVVCGRNDGLRERLERTGVADVFGWVQNMPELMRACDLVVQNAGGLTTSEALASGLPVLTYRCLPGHGRANADVLDADGIVPWVRRQEDLPEALGWACALAREGFELTERAHRPAEDPLRHIDRPLLDELSHISTAGGRASQGVRRAQRGLRRPSQQEEPVAQRVAG